MVATAMRQRRGSFKVLSTQKDYLLRFKKISTRFSVPAQSPSGIRYCPYYVSCFIVDIFIERYSSLRRSSEVVHAHYLVGDSIDKKPFSVGKSITPTLPQRSLKRTIIKTKIAKKF